MPPFVPLGLLSLGATNCFFGFRTLRLILAGWGALIGVFMANILSDSDPGAMLVAALIGAIAVFVLYKLGIFAMGALAGLLVGVTFTNALGIHFWVIDLLCWTVTASFGGGLALALEKPIIVLISSFSGALMLVLGCLFVLDAERFAPLWFEAVHFLPYPALLGFLVLGIAGVVFQFGGVKGLRKEWEIVVQQIGEFWRNWRGRKNETNGGQILTDGMDVQG